MFTFIGKELSRRPSWYHLPGDLFELNTICVKIWLGLDSCRDQGDRIGRVFAQWAIVYFGQLFENYRSSTLFP
jgi:hypothetical protein